LGRNSASIRSLRLEIGYRGQSLLDVRWVEVDVGDLVEFRRGNGPNPGL